MHMIGYIGGDHQVMKAAKAKEGPLRFAVDFPGNRGMLVFMVTQEGEVLVASTDQYQPGAVDHMQLIGRIMEEPFEIAIDPAMPVIHTDKPMSTVHLSPVPDMEDDD